MVNKESIFKIIDVYSTMPLTSSMHKGFYSYSYSGSNKILFIFGDVFSGDAEHNCFVKNVLSTLAIKFKSPSVILEKANIKLHNGHKRIFVNAIIGFINTRDNILEYSVSGNIALTLGRDSILKDIGIPEFFPLGIDINSKYKTFTMDTKKNDFVIAFSGEAVTIKNKLINSISEIKSSFSAQEINDFIANNFTDKPFNNIIVIKIKQNAFYKKLFPTSFECQKLIDEVYEYINFVDKNKKVSVSLIIDELTSNIIKHSKYSDKNVIPEMEVLIFKEDDNVNIIITDNSDKFDPTKFPLPDVNVNINQRRAGGLGIYIVKNKSKSMKYKRRNNRNINYIVV